MKSHLITVGLLTILSLYVTNASACPRLDLNCDWDFGGELVQATLPNDPTGGEDGTSSSLQSKIRTSGTRVSPAETAALLAVHNANAKVNSDRWETLVCSMRPVKGKTIEGILFRNEIPFWYNCNDNLN